MKFPIPAQQLRDFYYRHRLAVVAAQAVLFVIVGYAIARSLGEPSIPSKPDAAPEAAVAKAKSGTSLWTCSMHPQIRQPNPGDCPICGMDLIPVATSSGGLRTLAISPETRALMNIASTPVERRYVSHQIRMVGKVDFDETRLGYITAWVPGRLDRLYVDYTGVQVKKGDHMVYIYSPELYAAQQELIQALQSRAERPANSRFASSVDLVEAAREKLRLLGLTEEQLQAIERQEKPSDHLTIHAPRSGIVIEKQKQVGDYVKTGERIYTVADLDQVWVHLDAYESDLMWIRYGQDVTISAEAYPGEEFHGRIAFIQPVLNDRTRTVKVRVNVPNADGRLKPDMFVNAVVKPEVAAGGRVIDPGLAGKWISPMHPEIVRDEPGKCDICGMPLVRAETLGYVTPATDERQPPLVIPYSAALVTGRRAIVYVELPVIPDGIETAWQVLRAALDAGNLQPAREAFGEFSRLLDRPYGQPRSKYGRQLWNRHADRLAAPALAGSRASSIAEATEAFSRMEPVMTSLQEEFAPAGQPTFEGREIVLGPRAGQHFLVRHGLQEGELVVTRGNFKIDAEIQIQAKPSMMTPEGGGGGGHDHGGGDGQKAMADDDHSGHTVSLPAPFVDQLRDLEAAYQTVARAIEQKDVGKFTAGFQQFEQSLNAVDGSLLNGHPRMQWKEFAMLLGNDAVQGRDAQQMGEADRVFLLLKGHMRRLRDELGIPPAHQRRVARVAVSPEFQNDLAAVWERYLALQKQLADDDFPKAKESLTGLESALAVVDPSTLDEPAKLVWEREKRNLSNLIDQLRKAADIKELRTTFKPLSEEIGVLARAFGFGEAGPIVELHCPMAFQGQGAIWYQDSEQVRNPYFGSSMLKCADRVKRLDADEPAMPADGASPGDHSGH